MDISTLTIAQLKELLIEIPSEIKRREKNEKAMVLKEIQQLAAERGFSIDDLLDVGTKAKKVAVVAPKYRNPSDASLTWTGRGRQPKWVSEHIANGGSLESLAL